MDYPFKLADEFLSIINRRFPRGIHISDSGFPLTIIGRYIMMCREAKAAVEEGRKTDAEAPLLFVAGAFFQGGLLDADLLLDLERELNMELPMTEEEAYARAEIVVKGANLYNTHASDYICNKCGDRAESLRTGRNGNKHRGCGGTFIWDGTQRFYQMGSGEIIRSKDGSLRVEPLEKI